MKYYKKKYLMYSWPVYVIIFVLSFLLFYAVFEIKNNYVASEKLTVFICGLEVNKNDKYEEISNRMNELGIKQLNLDCYDYQSKNYPTILAVKGYYGSDILILDEDSYALWKTGGSPFDISDEYLAEVTNKSVLRCGDIEHLNSLKIYDYEDTDYNLMINQNLINFDGLNSNFYLVINNRSVHNDDGIIKEFIKLLLK